MNQTKTHAPVAAMDRAGEVAATHPDGTRDALHLAYATFNRRRGDPKPAVPANDADVKECK